MTVIARILFAAIAASMCLSSCADVGPKRPSDQPWGKPEAWESGARYGNFPQSR